MLVKIRTSDKSSEDLVDLLLACHDRIRSFAALARTAGERTDALESEIVDACSRVERYFTEALPLHVRDEEESLVPRLRGHSPELDRALGAMTEEHASHEQLLRNLLRASSNVRRDPAAAAARGELVAAAEQVARELGEHLALEEKDIFPVIRRVLSPTAQAEIVLELRRRREPDGKRPGAQ